METIGKISIDLNDYTGKDFCSDEMIENELLDIVKNYKKEEYDKIIYESGNGALLYHLSDIRGNIVKWMNNDKEATVLEIGSGCGTITGVLANKFGKVTCIELSKQRSFINAYRNKDISNIDIKVGNYKDISKKLVDKFDLITVIGVFKYAMFYMGGKNPYVDFLKSLRTLIKPNGTIIIAVENKFGLKYWAGCAEEHKGIIYEGLEDYMQTADVRTFSKRGLKEIVEEAGGYIDKFYYPYPDFNYPMTIYSDDRLPKEGELDNNFNNYDFNRIVTFDESKVFDCLIREKEFANYSNSFLIMVKNKEDYGD